MTAPPDTTPGMDRRRFLKVLGVTGGGAAALTGCSTDQVEKLIPYLVPVEDQVPGVATYYASTCRECSAGCGVHVRVREGRAVKLEGNPDHPINRGKLCSRAQAALQGTYNPDRIRGPLARSANGGFEEISWDDAIARLAERAGGAAADRLWFVTGNERGSFERLVGEWVAAFGSPRGHVVFEPLAQEANRHANREVFGTDALPMYNLAEARYVISFGADFLETWQSPMEQTRGFTASHAYRDGGMGRFVYVAPRMSMTGMSADEWIHPAAGREGVVALAMAQVILAEALGSPPADAARLRAALDAYRPAEAERLCGVPAATLVRLAREFTAGSSVALPGGTSVQHSDAHITAAAANVLNYVAGNVGRTVVFGPDVHADGGSTYQRVRDLVAAMRDGRVDVLLVHGANPVYATPSGLGVAEAMGSVGFKVSFSRFMDETTMLSDLVLPDHDPMEQWNDFQPRAGVFSFQQPVMQPVFDTRQTGDVLISAARQAGGAARQQLPAARADGSTYKDYLQDRWRDIQRQVGDRQPFDTFWRHVVQHGGVWTDVPARTVRLAPSAEQFATPGWSSPDGQFTLVAYPSTALFDGRAANRPWLQELPDPVTTITWGSWVEIHPDTAARLGIGEGEFVEVRSEQGSVEVPAYLYPGIREDVVAMATGQGHTAYGRYAEGRGASVYGLLPANANVFGAVTHYTSVTLRKTGAYQRLAKTEGRNRQMGRGIAQATTLSEARSHGFHAYHAPHAADVPPHKKRLLEEVARRQQEATRYGPYAYEQTRWAMAIDLSKCTGCGACIAACNAENNVPHVGEDQVRRGREMQWIRIERYYEGGENGEPLEARFVPMLCQHCGNAPCEPVCPVFAAYHTPDGLNGQIYNRCVGTRYCGNNCPYKVRYFNWYDHSTPVDPKTFAWPEPMNWLLNPDVTVRSKGVMEKCTFCVQRIRGAQNRARLDGTELRDGDVLTACQQTCPADAIVFGNLNDPDSRVAALAADDRGYQVLDGLNTRPAITYLQKVRNVVEA